MLVLMIATAIATYTALSSVADNMRNRQEAYTKYNAGFVIMYGGTPAGLTSDLFNSPSLNSYPFDDEIISQIESREGVEAVYKVTIVQLPYQMPDGGHIPIGLIGVETRATEAAILPYANMWEGKFLTPTDNASAIINIGLNNAISPASDKIVLHVLDRNYTLSAIGVYDSLLPEEMDPSESAVVDLDTFWQMIEVPPRLQRYSSLLVQVRDPSWGGKIAEELRNDYGKGDIYIIYQYELAKASVELMRSTSIFYGFIDATMLVAVGAVIMLIRILDLIKRKGEIGLLTAVGWRERDLVAYLFSQSLIIGVIGAALGTVISFVSGPQISRALIPVELNIMTNIRPEEPTITYLPYALLLTVSFSVTAFVGAYLYYRRLTPLKMLEDV
jgi:ABC-type lipoprotein release transport system permease subunit